MSKSLGNIVDPWDVIHQHGADAFRWYYLTSKQPWDGYLFSTETVGEAVRQFLLQLWNTYGFYVLYANVNDVQETAGPATELDRWALSRLQRTIAEVRDRMEDYDATRAGQAIAAFSDELSNWYVRRSRRRFWDGDPAAFGTLKTCLVELTKLLAPFCPFVADAIYENLDGSEPSVHLCDYPEADPALGDLDLEAAMAVARETVRLGLAARGHGKLKVRQPLRAAVVVAAGEERAAIERMRDVVLDELNVKELRCVGRRPASSAPTRSSPTTAALGPRFGKQMPQVAAAIEALEPAHVAGALRAGHRVGDRDRRPRPRARAQRPVAGHAAARGLPARARGLARRGARARARRRAAARGPRARGRARGAERAQGGGPRRGGPDRAPLGGDEELLGAARAHEALRHGGDARDEHRLRRLGGRRRRRPSKAASCGYSSTGRLAQGRAASPPRQRGLDLGLEALLRHRALDALGDLAVAEEQQGRDGHDLVLGRGLDVLVRVELDHLQLRALAGDLLDDRGHEAARATPGCPEVHEHGLIRLDDLCLEVGVGDLAHAGHVAPRKLLTSERIVPPG